MDIQTAVPGSHVDWRRLHALGLPAGSVRALLAILIFATAWGLLIVSSCQFCAQGGAGPGLFKSASALRVSGDGNAGGGPLRGSCTRRLAPIVPTVSIEPPPACEFSTPLRFTHSALEGSVQ